MNFSILVADIPITFSTRNISLSRLIPHYFSLSSNLPTYEYSIDVDRYMFSKRPRCLDPHYVFKGEEKNRIAFALKCLISIFMLRRNIVFVHGSSFFLKDKGAVLFVGASGVGKSTIVKNMHKQYVMSDDVAVLKKQRNIWYVYPSPFDRNKIDINQNNMPAKLLGIYTPVKSKTFSITDMPLHKQIQYITENSVLYLNAFFLRKFPSTDKKCKLLNAYLMHILGQTQIKYVYLRKGEDIYGHFSSHSMV